MVTGDNLFTFLSIGNAVDRAFSIYLNRWQLFTQLALIVVIPQILLSVTLRKTLIANDPEAVAAGTEDVFQSMSPQQIVVLVVEIAFSYLFGIIIQAAIIQVVAEYYTQKHSTFKGSLTLAFDRFCAIFGFGLLYSAALLIFSMVVGALVGSIIAFNGPLFLMKLIGFAAISFVIYVMLSLTIALPILVVENQSPIGGMKRSFELLPTYRCYVFCSMFLLAVVVIFGSLIYQSLIGAIFGASIVGSAFSGLSAVVTLPLQTM